jgi:hypothetical protein
MTTISHPANESTDMVFALVAIYANTALPHSYAAGRKSVGVDRCPAGGTTSMPTCDRSLTCELRARHPLTMQLHRRADIASPYQSTGAGPTVGSRLAAYAVLANNPAVPAVAADYWTHSFAGLQAGSLDIARSARR